MTRKKDRDFALQNISFPSAEGKPLSILPLTNNDFFNKRLKTYFGGSQQLHGKMAVIAFISPDCAPPPIITYQPRTHGRNPVSDIPV